MTKFHIRTKKEKLTEQEIGQQMNFDRFLSTRPQPVKPWVKPAKIFAGAGIAAAVITAGYFIYSSAQQEKNVAVTPFINPPVKNLDVPATAFIIDTKQDTTLISPTGSLIAVPNGSFVYPGGAPVMGKVELRYREFHDQADILLGGIPMEYDSAGKTWLFESAGMFEIAAYQDGKPLNLVPGKQLTVNLVSHTPENNYNIYYLDTVKRRWEYVSENTAENKTCTRIYDVDKEKEQAYLAAEKNNPLPGKPFLPGQANPSAYKFRIDYLANEFPELKIYDGLRFEIAEEEKNYDPKLAEKTWEDVYIGKTEESENYTITFSSENEMHTFMVKPVVEGKNYEQVRLDFETRQKKYDVLLAERKQKLEAKKDSMYRMKAVNDNVAIKSQLNERLTSFITGSYSEASKDLLVYRTFYVNRMGFWNSDRPWDFFDEFSGIVAGSAGTPRGEYHARFTSETGEPLALKTVFMLRRKPGSMFPVHENSFKQFPYKKDAADVIVGIGFDNRLTYLDDEELKLVNPDGKNLVFKMKNTGAEAATIEQLKSLLKI
ncbi:MAG: hypothetical protein FD123_786 [Bacteroidetes bacterium]|nr:MAG: hypothetical protein FD123_786 [Bacteroidota bacterium]